MKATNTLLIIAIALTSCQKEKATPKGASHLVNQELSETPELIGARNFLDLDYDAVIHLETPANYGLTPSKMNTNLQAAYKGESGAGVPMGDLDIDGVFTSPCIAEYNCHAGNFSTSLVEGNTLTLQWWNTNGERVLNYDIYYPKAFISSIPKVISEGTEITWNPDPDNTRGVVILVRTRMSDLTLVPVSGCETVYDYVENDNGSYTFNSAIISEITSSGGGAPNTLLEVNIMRGDYGTVNSLVDTDDIIAISTLSVVTALCELNP